MRVLLVHNFYKQVGGEDGVFKAEKELLEKCGYLVETYTDHNDRITELNKFNLLADTIWSRSSYQRISKILKTFKPDVVHCHNTFPLISPSIYYACDKYNVPLVQTLHNFRLLCPNALFYRNGNVCEECLGKDFYWPAIRYGCYHQSVIQSTVVAGMLFTHRQLGTWKQKVTRYIALTEFGRQKFIEGGLPAAKISVKPNFIKDPLKENLFDDKPRKGALFIGRLSPEKGIDTLLQAFQELPGIPLMFVGDGPLKEKVQVFSKNLSNIFFVGYQPKLKVLELMLQAQLLIFPSQWYEGFPMTLIESFACGTPVIASNFETMAEILRDGETGFLFPPGDAAALAATVRRALSNSQTLLEMGRRARETYLTYYTPEKNYEQLMAIYQQAIAAVGKKLPPE